MAGDYNIGDIYQGGYSSFKPNYGDIFTGYHVPASSLGATTNPTIANQIAEVNKILSQGVVPIEVGSIKPDIFEAIPKHHFKELRRMAKLTGAELTMHSPIVEPSGIGEGGWSETNRKAIEYQLNDVVEKAREMDPNKNIPITVHSANMPGTEYIMTPEGKKIERMMIINQETGQVSPLREEIRYYPERGSMMELKPEIEEKYLNRQIKEGEIKPEHYREIPLEQGKILTPEKLVKIQNTSQWDDSISQVIFNKERADEILQRNSVQIAHLQKELDEGKISPESLTPTQRQVWNHYINARTYIEDVDQKIGGLFSKAYRYGNEKQKKVLAEIRNNYQKELDEKGKSVEGQSEAMQSLIHTLKNPVLAPQIFKPVTDFAMEQSSKTFGDVAFNAFKKFGEKAPVISIENVYPGIAFSTGKEMDNLILASKKRFVENATTSGYSKSEAEKYADKLIGLTFDVGHLNIHRKHGFKEEDLMKEFKAMSKHIKHLHLTDNFGSYDSHLPPGMGNVPTKKYLEELEKQGFKGKTIVEAGGFINQFGTSPYVPILEAFGSGFYSGGPYWNQTIGLQQGYLSGMGEILPGIHYETFGAGFSQLPSELGGQKGGGAGSRMSGRPME